MRIIQGVVFLILLCLSLTACGQEPPPAQPPATTGSVSPTTSASTAAGTAASTQVTLGDLASRVAAAWPNVKSYRWTFTGATVSSPGPAASPTAQVAATPGATPLARPRSTFVSTREVALPDRQRQVVSGLGADDHEAIVTGNKLFVRGPMVMSLVSTAGENDWITIDLTKLPAGERLPPPLDSLRALPQSPLANLPDRLKPQVVRDLGNVDFDGRTCHVYGAADTVPDTGMRLDYTIALDQQDLPCFIETSTGGVTQGRDEFTGINSSILIESPQAATPVSDIAVSGTPVGRD